jgi:hypothetical protein
VLVPPDAGFRLLGQRVKWMLHVLHHILKHSIGHIADEEIMLRVPLWKKSIIRVRGFYTP